MEQFEALPLPHKVLMVFLALASIAGVFYFVLIGDLEEEIASSQAKVRKTEQSAAQLKRYENKELMAAVEAELAELKEQLAANKALLPEDEMIPSLITTSYLSRSRLSQYLMVWESSTLRGQSESSTLLPPPRSSQKKKFSWVSESFQTS